MIGKPILGASQASFSVERSNPDRIQPADSAAAGYYITNAYNTYIGNAGSGGWSVYSFPNLPLPIEFSRNVPFSPERRKTLVFDGNSAHSSGNWMMNGGACVYVGGYLYLFIHNC